MARIKPLYWGIVWALAQSHFLVGCSEIQAVATPTTPIQNTTVYIGNEAAANWRAITRDEHTKLLRLGTSLDDEGYFTTPILLTDVGLRADLPNGWLKMPMEWDPERSILLRIQDGYMTQHLFHLNP